MVSGLSLSLLSLLLSASAFAGRFYERPQDAGGVVPGPRPRRGWIPRVSPMGSGYSAGQYRIDHWHDQSGMTGNSSAIDLPHR